MKAPSRLPPAIMPLVKGALLALALASSSCRDEEAARMAERQRMEREIRNRVAAGVERRVAEERLRTWRIAGFCALGAGAVGGLVWLNSLRPGANAIRPAVGREVAAALLPGPLASGTIQPETQPLTRPWTPPPGRVIDTPVPRRERHGRYGGHGGHGGHGGRNKGRNRQRHPRQPHNPHERTDRR